jgi:DNA mismatch repair protein MutL
LLTGRHPITVINIQIPPTLIDVNVHPAKTEIRFLKERRVFSAILRAVRQALLEEPEMPRWKSHDSAAAPPAPVASENDFDEEDIREIEAAGQSEVIAQQDRKPAQDRAALYPGDNPWMTVTEEETGTQPLLLSRLWQSHIRPSEPPLTDTNEKAMTQPSAHQEQATTSELPGPGGWQLPGSGEQPHKPLEEFPTRQAPAAQDIGAQVSPQQAQRLPRLRVIGQLAQSYIVTEGDDGMYLVDQHAAHERILLERMIAALQAHQPVSQLLLTPIALELAPSEMEAIEEHKAQLERIGFTLEPFDHHTIHVCAVPGVLAKQVNARSIHELLLDLTAEENLGHTETWEERALANVACKAAIKAHYFLTVSEMREMLEQLEQTKAPYSCCHGRPTMVHFGLSALEREFGRR